MKINEETYVLLMSLCYNPSISTLTIYLLQNTHFSVSMQITLPTIALCDRHDIITFYLFVSLSFFPDHQTQGLAHPKQVFYDRTISPITYQFLIEKNKFH